MESKFCQNCGEKSQIKAKFCQACGNPKKIMRHGKNKLLGRLLSKMRIWR